MQWYYRDHGYSASFHELTLGAVTAQCWWMYASEAGNRIWCWRIGGRLLGNPHDCESRLLRKVVKTYDPMDGHELNLPLAKLAALTALLERSRRRNSGKWKLSATQRAKLQTRVTLAHLAGGDETPSEDAPENEFG